MSIMKEIRNYEADIITLQVIFPFYFLGSRFFLALMRSFHRVASPAAVGQFSLPSVVSKRSEIAVWWQKRS